MNKPQLFVSFSGGKSSAYMSRRLQTEYADKFDMRFVFANTGQEREETLKFVHRCDEEWSLDVVWVESVVHHGIRKAPTHKIVTFDTAARNGEPFEEVVKKYGIPNKAMPQCTRDLKLNPMRSYLRSIGWEKYRCAIGIRADEPKRLRQDADTARIVYPLAHWFPTDKLDVNDWWEDQPFNLALKDYEGNCAWCWKKSLLKHFRLIDERPELYAFPDRMEREYSHNGPSKTGEPKRFFRENRSTHDLFMLRIAAGPRDWNAAPMTTPDDDAGCSESCDINAEIGAAL